MSKVNILIYLVRRDVRVSDNPILHRLASSTDHGFSHLLPVYVFPAHQIEVSGFIKDGSQSPYPEARSRVARFWRCGPHRAKFIAQSVWNLKESLESIGSGLTIRVGGPATTLETMINKLKEQDQKVGAVWMISEEGVEEKQDEKAIAAVCSTAGVDFQAWDDEKYFIDDRDVNMDVVKDLPDVFTSYRKLMEPLRDRPRATLPKPSQSALPPCLSQTEIPAQQKPFKIPGTYDDLEAALLGPIKNFIDNPPAFPENITSAHPFQGGETHALDRLDQIIKTGVVYDYKTTRNGLLGADFSTKLSGYLSIGCITARQVHEALVAYEDGTKEAYSDAQGYGEGENEGSKSVRFELLWRDYMRLCTRKFKHKLFRRSGFREDSNAKWKTPVKEEGQDDSQNPSEVDKTLKRIYAGTTGMGLIDASQRELIHTGYTSNRARQNVASFIAKHLGIDWRYGAEWYEMLLIDYDVSSNWANWQYVSGVGNDPRGEARIFNPVKQAFDYDKEGKYVRIWVPEVHQLDKLENVFQAWTTPKEDWERLGLAGLPMAEDPVKKIEFSVDHKPKQTKRPFDRRRKDGRIRSNANIASRGLNQPTDAPPEGSETSGQQRPPQFAPLPRSPRGNFRGGRGGYRGRGYGGGGGYRGGRGQYLGPVPPANPWPNSSQPT